MGLTGCLVGCSARCGALYEPEGQSAYVYILNNAGQPEKREVVVGLKTIASAEVTNGLSEGEKIITSQMGEQQ